MANNLKIKRYFWIQIVRTGSVQPTKHYDIHFRCIRRLFKRRDGPLRRHYIFFYEMSQLVTYHLNLEIRCASAGYPETHLKPTMAARKINSCQICNMQYCYSDANVMHLLIGYWWHRQLFFICFLLYLSVFYFVHRIYDGIRVCNASHLISDLNHWLHGLPKLEGQPNSVAVNVRVVMIPCLADTAYR